MLNAQSRVLSVSALQADWRQQTLRLLAPARIGFADGVAIDRLRLGLRQAVLEVSGRVGATLDLTASLRNLPADLATAISPDFAADGTLQADAHHRHVAPTDRQGKARSDRVAGPQRSRRGPSRRQASPRRPTLNGTDAQIDAQIRGGSSHLKSTGRAPLARDRRNRTCASAGRSISPCSTRSLPRAVGACAVG